jgi:hypothetical protein
VDETDRLLGIVSRGDLLRIFLRRDDAIRDEITEDVPWRTMGLAPSEVTAEVRDGRVELGGSVEFRSLIPSSSGCAAASTAWSRSPGTSTIGTTMPARRPPAAEPRGNVVGRKGGRRTRRPSGNKWAPAGPGRVPVPGLTAGSAGDLDAVCLPLLGLRDGPVRIPLVRSTLMCSVSEFGGSVVR